MRIATAGAATRSTTVETRVTVTVVVFVPHPAATTAKATSATRAAPATPRIVSGWVLRGCGLRRRVALTRVARQHRRSVEALGEAERPRDERLYPGGIGMDRVHQHDVRLGEDLRANCRQQAAALLEPLGHPVANRIVAVGV